MLIFLECRTFDSNRKGLGRITFCISGVLFRLVVRATSPEYGSSICARCACICCQVRNNRGTRRSNHTLSIKTASGDFTPLLGSSCSGNNKSSDLEAKRSKLHGRRRRELSWVAATICTVDLHAQEVTPDVPCSWSTDHGDRSCADPRIRNTYQGDECKSSLGEVSLTLFLYVARTALCFRVGSKIDHLDNPLRRCAVYLAIISNSIFSSRSNSPTVPCRPHSYITANHQLTMVPWWCPHYSNSNSLACNYDHF